MIDNIIAFLFGGFIGMYFGIFMMALFAANRGGGYDEP